MSGSGDDGSVEDATAAPMVVPPMVPPVAVVPIVVVPVSRFCKHCGREMEPGEGGCVCLSSTTEAESEAVYTREKGDVRSALVVYFGCLLAVGVATLIGALGEDKYSAALGFGVQGCIGVIAIWASWRHRERVWPVVRKVPRLRWVGAAAGVSLLTFGLAELSVVVFRWLELPVLSYLEEYRAGGFSVGWAVVGMCVMPALFEELAFRGVIQTGVVRVLGVRETIVVVAFMFAILHLSMLSFPLLVVMGLALGISRQWSGSIWPGVVLHFLHNFWVLMSEFIRET